MKKIIYSRAPVRICDIGGWTDTWFYPNGAIFNICVDLYSYVRIIQNNSSRIKIVSENLNLNTEINDFSEIEYLSSAGLRVMISFTKILKTSGGYLVIFSVIDNVMEIIKIAGFEAVLNLLSNETEALQYQS